MRPDRQNPYGLAPSDRVFGPCAMAIVIPSSCRGPWARGVLLEIERPRKVGDPTHARVLLDGGLGVATWRCSDLNPEESL